MFRIISLVLLLLCCGVSCVWTTPAEKGAVSWEQAMQRALARAEAKDYDFVIDNLLAPEAVGKATKEFASPDGWRAEYIEKELKNLPYYFGWLKERKIEDRGDEVHLLGKHGCFAVFHKSGERWYLLDFGQKITSM